MTVPEPSPGGSRLHPALAPAIAGAVALFAALILYNTLRIEGGYTPDSLFYIDAARNLLDGRGLVSSMAELDRLIAANQPLPVPFTMWAPLYPLAIAALAAVGVPATAAALVVAGVAFACVLFSGFLLAQRIAGTAAGVLAVALLAHMPPLLAAAQTAWSETLGLTFLLLAIWLLLPSPRESTGSAIWIPLVAGNLAGLAFGTRYALLPLVAFGPAFYLAQQGRRGTRPAVLFIAGASIVALPVVFRNFTSDGLPTGAADTTNQIALADNIARLLPALAASLWHSGFLFNVLALLFAVFVAYALLRRKSQPGHFPAFRSAVVVLAGWAIAYLAFLLVAQYRVRIDPLNARLLLPVTVVIPPLIAAVALRLGLPRRAAATFAAAFLAVALYEQADNARLIFNTRIPPVYAVAERTAQDGPIAWLAQRVEPGDLIIAEDGLDLPFYLGPVNTAFFSKAHTPGFRLDADTLFTYLDTHACNGANVWLLVANQMESTPGDRDVYDFHDALRTGALLSHERVQSAAAFADYRIYSLSCEAWDHAE